MQQNGSHAKGESIRSRFKMTETASAKATFGLRFISNFTQLIYKSRYAKRLFTAYERLFGFLRRNAFLTAGAYLAGNSGY
jgi:hypothetical protein